MNSIQKKENAKPAARHEEFLAPNVDIFETDDGYVLEAEMPGVNKDGLEITVQGTEITITGRRHNVVPSGVALIAERRSVDFRRSFELDPATDSSRISARMNQGVLTLSLPKSEKVKPRKIQVTAEA
jgi:HSP20 family protein